MLVSKLYFNAVVKVFYFQLSLRVVFRVKKVFPKNTRVFRRLIF